MCILFLHYSPTPNEGSYCLIVANNRDEVLERPTAPATFWEDHTNILAGRDLLVPNGGSWLGISLEGRFCALTNYRTHVGLINPHAQTRGRLVVDFLTTSNSPLDYCQNIERDIYNGFSLLTADLRKESVVYYSNRDPDSPRSLAPGTYCMSNSLLNSPWLKVTHGKKRFSEIISSPSTSLADDLFALLCDDTCHDPDPSIPDTGFTDTSRINNSAIFVNPCAHNDGTFTTRTQTVLLVDHSGEVMYIERTVADFSDLNNLKWTTSTHQFNLSSV